MTATTTQAFPFLMTKLFVPRVQTDLVFRERVFQRFEEGLGKKLTLISAPAGFGKTSLITSWLQAMPDADITTAWLSLDNRDNEIERFLGYLVETLHRADERIGNDARELIQSSTAMEPEIVATSLINDTGMLPGDVLLVLDDYHVIETPAIHAAMNFLIEHAPPQLHLVITSRIDPPLALSRMRGRGEMTDIRAEDLRFTIEETAEFLRSATGVDVSGDNVVELEQRTEGWITGLQLAAISLRDRDDAHSFIQSFSGQHHHIYDYLVDEVLNRESPATQEFLLKTAIFGQFTADLCNAVTDRSDSQATLEYLERSNLFIISLDSERRWFRYHHLFADLLRRKLRQSMPGHIPELRMRASAWFEEHDNPVEAIWQSINGEDWPRVSSLIKTYERPMFNQGLSKTLLRLLNAVPEAVMQTDPWLLFTRAASYDLNGEVDLCVRDLKAVERLIDRFDAAPERAGDVSEEELRHLRAAALRTWAFIAIPQMNFELSRAKCDEALRYIPEDDFDVRALTIGIRSQSFWLTGDLAGAASGLRETLELSRLADAAAARLVGLLGLASIEVEWGRLDDAEKRYAEAVDYANSHGLAEWQYTGRIISFQSEVPYERNDLDRALELAERGRDLAGHWASRHAFDVTYLNLARVLRARHDLEAARALLSNAPPYIMGPGIGSVAETAATLALLELELGGRVRLNGIESDLLTPVSELSSHLWLWTPAIRARGQLLNALEREDDAIGLLGPLFNICVERSWTRQAVQIGAVLSLSYQRSNNERAASDIFARVLELAEPRGFLRSILDAGAGIDAVIDTSLARRRDQGEDSVYLNLLHRLAHEEQQARQGSEQTPQRGLVEPLSDRELEVLRLIAAGYTNAQIADQLFVVVGTIKTHAHNIYAKLGVRNRTQAINRGRDLGLVA